MRDKSIGGIRVARAEMLEPRRLLSSVTSLEGTYSGMETYTLDGRQLQVTQTFSLGPPIQKSSTAATQSANDRLSISILAVFDPLTVLTFRGGVKLLKKVLSTNSLSAHSGSVSPLASTEYIGSLPSAFGPEGIVRIDGSTLRVSGDLTTGIFPVNSFSFVGTKVTPKKSKTAALSDPPPPITTLGIEQALKVSPDLGTFIGHMTRQSDSAEFTTKALISNNKKGKPAIHFSLAEPDVGTIEIDSEIKPTHTGAFTLFLGGSSVDGVLGGHITHTGRLVLDLTLPGFAILVGSQKRHH